MKPTQNIGSYEHLENQHFLQCTNPKDNKKMFYTLCRLVYNDELAGIAIGREDGCVGTTGQQPNNRKQAMQPVRRNARDTLLCTRTLFFFLTKNPVSSTMIW